MQKRLIGFALIMLLWGQTAAASTVLVVGDSISAAFGLDTRQGWVALLQERMAAEGFSEHVVNASISGDTTAGGASRLPTLLQEHKPKVVVVELGGNDGLRGLAPVQMQQNLSSMIEQSKQAGAEVLLLGMQLPPNYGKRYTTAFANVFSDLAREQQVALVPFLLQGVGGVPRLMQADGIHPAAEAQSILLENVWPQLKPLL